VPATYIIRIAESWVVTTDRFSFLVLRKQERVALLDTYMKQEEKTACPENRTLPLLDSVLL